MTPTKRKETTASHSIGTRRELFVDDFLIETMRDVRLELQHPERRETFTFDAPWEDNTASPSSVVTDQGVVRLYYRAGIADLHDEERTGIVAVLESRDGGLSFTRPNLGLHEFKGVTTNNILAIGLPGVPPVFLDTNPACRDGERFKGLGAWGGGLRALGSADGLRWRMMQEAPLVYSGAFDTINTAFWDTVAGCYRSYTRAWVSYESPEGAYLLRTIQTATSPDFIHWSAPVQLEYADGEGGVHLYTNAAQPCPGAEHLYVAFPNRFMAGRRRGVMTGAEAVAFRQGYEGCNDALFMVSRDGVRWTRYLDAWVRPGPDECNWGQRNNYPTWGLVLTSATEWSQYINEHYMQPDAPGRFRRLSIRPHRFISVHADWRGGEFTTRPLMFDGECLRLNYATSAAGQIQVELQDADGRPLSGHRLEDMEPLFGDELDGGVTWKSGSDLTPWIGKPVRLRFVMRDADVFALRFGPRVAGISHCEVVPLPPHTYETRATCAEIRVRPATGTVAIDAKLDDWDLSAALNIRPPQAFADRCHARIAMMYDAEALYVAGDVADPWPMVNALGFDGDLFNSWNADALQFRLRAVADGLPEGAAAEVNDVRLWHSTQDRRPGCCVIVGNSEVNKPRLNPAGVQGAYRLRADGTGYVFEYRIPWSALNSTRAPRRGEKLTACIQCHWGTEKGDDLLCGAVDVRVDSSKMAAMPESWGQAVFE